MVYLFILFFFRLHPSIPFPYPLSNGGALQGVQGVEEHRRLSLKVVAERVEGVRYGAEVSEWVSGREAFFVAGMRGIFLFCLVSLLLLLLLLQLFVFCCCCRCRCRCRCFSHLHVEVPLRPVVVVHFCVLVIVIVHWMLLLLFLSCQHWGEDFYMVTNKDGCKNSKLVKAPIRYSYSMYDYIICWRSTICSRCSRRQFSWHHCFLSVAAAAAASSAVILVLLLLCYLYDPRAAAASAPAVIPPLLLLPLMLLLRFLRSTLLFLCSSPGAENWTDVVPYDPAVCLKGVLCFENHIVLSGRWKKTKKIFPGLPKHYF